MCKAPTKMFEYKHPAHLKISEHFPKWSAVHPSSLFSAPLRPLTPLIRKSMSLVTTLRCSSLHPSRPMSFKGFAKITLYSHKKERWRDLEGWSCTLEVRSWSPVVVLPSNCFGPINSYSAYIKLTVNWTYYKIIYTHHRAVIFFGQKNTGWMSSVMRLSEFELYFTDQAALLGSGVECTMAPNSPSTCQPRINPDPRLYDQS